MHPTVDDPPLKYMWYYRTEVRNTLDVPLTIVWFEAYRWDGKRWRAGNVTGRDLTAQDFSDWYADGVEIIDGTIPAGGVAVDNRNWHGSDTRTATPIKWAYSAVDPSGKEHYAEVIVESVPIKR
jgi:hypothetical protein